MRLSGRLVEIELSWSWDKLTLNKGRNRAFIGVGSTHIVEQLSFSIFLSILTFDFDLILGSFLTSWGPNGLFLGLG